MHDVPRALTLDLDDTLWPNREVIQRAEAAFHAWLQTHAPRTAARFPPAQMRLLRATLHQRHPALVHDLTTMRLLTTREALMTAGEDPAHAQVALDVFVAERQRVVLYEDTLHALERLARRYPLVALTNGNADLHRVGVARWFVGALTARDVGIAKPDARMFYAGCARLGLPPASVMHVGDHWELDVLGARDAGLHSAWVRRPDGAESSEPPPAPPATGLHLVVDDLVELADKLGA